jgi:GNAT superfamily N-acetyltransferase
MEITLRPGVAADANPCGMICHRAFTAIANQHNFPSDFPTADTGIGLMRLVLSRPDIYSIVAESAGRIVGSNFLWEATRIVGVGPITVDPDIQNAAVGRRLMDDVLHRAATTGAAGIRLVQAAYHNRSLSLYTKLGFDTREPLSNMQGSPIRREVPGHPVRPATPGDIEACNSLCRNVHGHDRGPELLDAVAQKTATIVERNGRITGYATLVGFFGHTVGETNEDLEALIASAPAFAGPGFLLPTRNAELFRWCLAQGLRVVQPLTLMTIGLYNEPRGAYLPSILY